jgi:hypothetical protein
LGELLTRLGSFDCKVKQMKWVQRLAVIPRVRADAGKAVMVTIPDPSANESFMFYSQADDLTVIVPFPYSTLDTVGN